MTSPRRSVMTGVRRSVNVFHLKFQNILWRVESQACLLEYKFPRAFPSHTSYPSSDRINAVKRNKPLTSKVHLDLLLQTIAQCPFLCCVRPCRSKTHTLNKLKPVLIFKIIIIFFHSHFVFLIPFFIYFVD